MKKQKTQSKLIVALTAVVLLLVALSATLTFAYFTASSNATSDSMTFGTLGVNIDELNTEVGDDCAAHAMADTAIAKLVPGCELTLGEDDNITVSGNIAAFVRATLTITAWQTHQIVNGNAVAFGAGDVYVPAQNETPASGIEGVKGYNADGTEYTGNGEADFYAIKTEATAVDGASAEFASVIFTTMGDVSGWIAHTPSEGARAGITSYYYATAVTNDDITFTDTFTLSATALGNAWQGAIMEINIVVDAIQAEHLGLTNVDADTTITSSNVAELAGHASWGDADGVIGA